MRDPLDARLGATPFTGRIVRHALLASTIDECRALADAGAPEGTVVIATAQSAGRGQRGNTWHSPRGAGLYLSALLRPPLAPAEMTILPQAIGFAACDALRDGFGVDAWMKHPNDLLAVQDGTWRKLGGMLVDGAVQADTIRHAIVSIGLNCAEPEGGRPDDIASLATSLEALGVTATPDDVAAAFLTRLARVRAAMAGDDDWRDVVTDRTHQMLVDVRPGDRATLPVRATWSRLGP